MTVLAGSDTEIVLGKRDFSGSGRAEAAWPDEAHGHTVVAAAGTGPAVLDALLTHRPDVAIIDVRLPPTFTDEGLRAALAGTVGPRRRRTAGLTR